VGDIVKGRIQKKENRKQEREYRMQNSKFLRDKKLHNSKFIIRYSKFPFLYPYMADPVSGLILDRLRPESNNYSQNLWIPRTSTLRSIATAEDGSRGMTAISSSP
jgi:hypothetical protein